MNRVGSAVVEIACDESGFSGTNLLDAPTPVFTHASVDLRVDEAVELIGALRSGFWWSLKEFKSGQFLRGPQAGEALEWFLAALRGRAPGPPGGRQTSAMMTCSSRSCPRPHCEIPGDNRSEVREPAHCVRLCGLALSPYRRGYVAC